MRTILKIRSSWIAIPLLVLVGASVAFEFWANPMGIADSGTENELAEIVQYHPYGPLFPMDPTNVYSVGDQVLSEHIFGYHAKSSIEGGLEPSLSEVSIDRTRSTIKIKPRFSVKRSDGTSYSIDDVCAAISRTFKSGVHTPYASLLNEVECSAKEITIKLDQIPLNLDWLFTVPDFSMFDVNALPIERESRPATTGPYSYEGLGRDSDEVVLKRNPHYPESLTANSVNTVKLRRYQPNSTSELVDKLNPSTDHLAYLYGHSLTSSDLKKLQRRGYKIQIQPSDWVLYLGFHPRVPLEDRVTIASVIDSNRGELASSMMLGQPAFSFCPSDRPFCLSEGEYREATKQLRPQRGLSKKYKVSTYSYWSEIPLFRQTLNVLTENISDLSEQHAERDTNIYSDSDVYLAIMGVSPSDPVSHYSFQLAASNSLNPILSRDELVKVATSLTDTEFIDRNKKIEIDIATKRLMIPLGHFPGVVAESPRFRKKTELDWAWGIQSWTYQITSHD